MPHTHEKDSYPELSFSSFFNKLIFDVGNTLIIMQRESQKLISNAQFVSKFCKVTVLKKSPTTCQIWKLQKYNASDSDLKKKTSR